MCQDWRREWQECVESAEDAIVQDPSSVSWKGLRKMLEGGYRRALAMRLGCPADPSALKQALPRRQGRQALLNSLKNLEEATRYIKYRLADFARHTAAHRAARYQNAQRTRIAWHRRKWLLAVLGWCHGVASGYNKSIARFGAVAVGGMIVTFALLYWVVGGAILPPEGLEGTLRWYHYIYYSAVTLATLGYGDFHPNPNSSAAMLLSAMEAIIGYILLAFLVTILFQVSDAHPPSPPGWSDWYRNKRADRRFF